jgi:hypothetical protein
VKVHKLLKTNYFDELVGEEIKSYREYLEPNSQDLVFRDKFRNEEGSMWLALASIVLASAIGFNVLALWLTGWFERNESESAFSQRNKNAQLIAGLGCKRTAVNVLLMGQKVCLWC